MADDKKSPIDQALDLFVFAPLGLALTAKDELPGLVEKGRQRASTQVMMARMIGKFAVAQGQKEAEKAAASLIDQVAEVANRIGGLPSAPGTTGGASGAVPPTRPAATAAPTPAPLTAPLDPRTKTTGAIHRNGSGNGAAPGPAADELAIPGYDSLSASQVVQRLAGLSPTELAAVGHYEEAHRGRRTILSKVAQLQADRS
jgi:hypothetical protein